MLQLQKADGSWTTFNEEIGLEVVKYYKELFGSNGKNDIDEILDGILVSIIDQVNDSLTKLIEDVEIKNTIFSMNPNKTPGPDRMTLIFF